VVEVLRQQSGGIRAVLVPGNAGEFVDSARLSGADTVWRTPFWRRMTFTTDC